jgi:hypothetical protein
MKLLFGVLATWLLIACDPSDDASATNTLLHNAAQDEGSMQWARMEPGNASRVVVSSTGYNFQYRAAGSGSPWKNEEWLTALLVPSDGTSPTMIDRLQLFQDSEVDGSLIAASR